MRFCVGVVLTLLLCVLQARADSGVDLIVVVDQSGSMWGHTRFHAAPAGNDKLNYRITAIDSILGSLASHASGSPRVNRVSLIEFASTGAVVVDQIEFSYDPSVPGGIALKRNAAMQSDDGRRVGDLTRFGVPTGSVDYFLTDTVGALRLAVDQASQLASSDPDASRRRVVFLLTDGRPCIPQSRTGGSCSSSASISQARRQISALNDRLEQSGFQLYVAGFKAFEQSTLDYWSGGDGQFWLNLVGSDRAQLYASSEVPGAVAAWLDDVTGVSSVSIQGDSFSVRPYQTSMTLKITAPDITTIAPNLLLPDGRAIPPSNSPSKQQVGVSGVVEFALSDPEPGNYEIVSDPIKRGTATKQLSQVGPHPILVSKASQAYARNVAARLEYTLNDSSGQQITALPDWPILGGEVEVTSPDGGVQIVALQFEAASQVLVGQWTPLTEGEHLLDLKVEGADFNGVPYELVSSGLSRERIQVSDVAPFFAEFSNWGGDQPLRIMPWSQNHTFSFNLIRDGGQVVSVADVAANPSSSIFEVVLLDKSGVPLGNIAPIALQDDGGVLTADVPINLDILRGEGWLRPKELYLAFRPLSTNLRPGEGFGGLRLPQSLSAARVAGVENSLGPVEFRLNALFLMALGLVPILLLLGILFLLWAFLRSFFLIKFEDSKKQQTVELQIVPISVESGAMRPGVRAPTGRDRFELTGKSKVVSKNATTVKSSGATYKFDKIAIIREPGGDSDTIRAEVRYKISGSKKMQSVSVKSNQNPVVIKGLPSDDWGVLLRKAKRGHGRRA